MRKKFVNSRPVLLSPFLTFLFLKVVNITFSQTMRGLMNTSLERKRLISFFILIAVNFIGSGMVFSSFAQEFSSNQTSVLSSWQTKIDQLKQKARSLLDENDRYAQENATLTKELAFLQNNKDSGQNPFLKEQIKSEQELNFWKNKISSLEEDNKILSKELLIFKQKENLRNLQIEDLEYQKRQLVLGNKLQAQSFLKEQIKTKKAASVEYYSQLQGAVLRKEFQFDQVDLKRIQQQGKDLKRQRVSLNKEINSLKAQNAVQIVAAEKEYAQKRKVKRTLESTIEDLEKKNSSVRQSLEGGSVPVVQTIQTDQKLEAELNDVQNRNRELSKQVGSMNNNISDLTKDIKNMQARAKDVSKEKRKQ